MNMLMPKSLFLTAFGAFSLVCINVSLWAAEPAASEAAAPALPYGVPQVIQLSQAQISESTIVAYVKNSGNSYGLDASQIIYLRQQGVSDNVLNAMLSQPKPGSVAVSAVSTLAAQAPAPVVAPVTQVVAAPVTYVPASTVYVIPDTATDRYYNSYYAYPRYYSPLSVSIGFGGYYRGCSRGVWRR